MNEEKLINDGISFFEEDNQKYFNWEEIKEKYKEVKTDKSKGIKKEGILYVLAKNVQNFTMFDHKINNALNYNNKK